MGAQPPRDGKEPVFRASSRSRFDNVENQPAKSSRALAISAGPVARTPRPVCYATSLRRQLKLIEPLDGQILIAKREDDATSSEFPREPRKGLLELK